MVKILVGLNTGVATFQGSSLGGVHCLATGDKTSKFTIHIHYIWLLPLQQQPHCRQALCNCNVYSSTIRKVGVNNVTITCRITGNGKIIAFSPNYYLSSSSKVI